MTAIRLTLVMLALLAGVFSGSAAAQTPRVPPHPEFVFANERDVRGLTVQQWVNKASPEISPSGTCECITVVYQGARLILTLGQADLVSAMAVHELSGRDINGDGRTDLIVTDWSGGAHCCYSIDVYSLEQTPKPLLSLNVGNCGTPDLSDLNGDGRLEIITCDDQWSSAYCVFAFAPMPRVVFEYDRARGKYVPATPRFRNYFSKEVTVLSSDAQRQIADNQGRDPGLDKCAVLGPALAMMYQGRFTDGVTLIRRLYKQPDRQQFERDTVGMVRSSPLWTANR